MRPSGTEIVCHFRQSVCVPQCVTKRISATGFLDLMPWVEPGGLIKIWGVKRSTRNWDSASRLSPAGSIHPMALPSDWITILCRWRQRLVMMDTSTHKSGLGEAVNSSSNLAWYSIRREVAVRARTSSAATLYAFVRLDWKPSTFDRTVDPCNDSHIFGWRWAATTGMLQRVFLHILAVKHGAAGHRNFKFVNSSINSGKLFAHL